MSVRTVCWVWGRTPGRGEQRPTGSLPAVSAGEAGQRHVDDIRGQTPPLRGSGTGAETWMKQGSIHVYSKGEPGHPGRGTSSDLLRTPRLAGPHFPAACEMPWSWRGRQSRWSPLWSPPSGMHALCVSLPWLGTCFRPIEGGGADMAKAMGRHSRGYMTSPKLSISLSMGLGKLAALL